MRFAIAGVCLLLTAGCAGAPVQEMSNARQAVRAAHEALAERRAHDGMTAEDASHSLDEADTLLSQAESAMRSFKFRDARSYAVEARGKALEMLQNLQTTSN